MILKGKLFGLGFKRQQRVKRVVGCNLNKNNLSINKLKQFFLKKIKVKGLGNSLKNRQLAIVSFEKRLKTYRGLRHKNKLPCRGQRTHTNANNAKKSCY